MATPAAIPTDSARDNTRHISRTTRGGRQLFYQLTVLQQPERARACGSGMKANSDRRPVDPPPVVELRIREGPTLEEAKDITFDYNANFFLYASLEHARPVAHGRVQTPAATNPPILTGVPASGMAYLDRPTEAGYFIFPDLSVRHEGRYRLTFSLFETTKEEKDFDPEPSDGELPPGVDYRMEIQTLPFSVFSAKKFPGLMESTMLSKTVADQGCRVRIRRDVRMRKRDNKSSSNNYDSRRSREEDFSRRRDVTPVTEDPHGIRARSLSNSSEQRAPYPEPQRRPSVVDAYHAAPPPPPPSYDSAPPSRHLSFGDSAGSQQYPPPRPYAAPPQPNVQLTPVSATGPYPPSNPSPYSRPEPAYGYSNRNMPPQSCPSPAAPIKQEVYDRRHSGSGYVPPSPSVYSDGYHSRHESQHSYPPTPVALQPPRPPLQTQPSLPPLKISALVSPPIEVQTEPLPEPPIMSVGGKRKHDSVFAQSLRPLHNGRRQLDPHFGGSRRNITPEPEQGMYSRADGQVQAVTFSRWQE